MPTDKYTSEDIEHILDVVKQRDQQERIIEIEEKTVQLVVALLGEHYYGFYGEYIKEIVTVGEIAFVPGMPHYIPGVITVRGEIESVLDVAKLLNLPSAPVSKQHRIMIGEIDEIRSGLLVDAVEDVLELPEEQISQPASVPDAERAKFIIGETMYHDHELILLDVKKIFENLLNYSS